MKILFMVDYYQPKLGYGSYYIPRELARLGHNVTIFTSNYYYPFPKYEETAGKILGSRRIMPGITKENGVTVVRKAMKLEIFTRAIVGGQEEYIRRFKPDIVIVDKTAGFNQIVASILKNKYKYRLISIDAHLPSGFKAEGNIIVKNIFYWLFRLFFSKLINKATDKFIAVQEETVLIIKKYYGVRKKIVHIPLGTDLDLFNKDPVAGSKIKGKYKITPKDFVIIYTGKVIEEKGVDILFKAINILLGRNKKLKLLIVGSGSRDYQNYCESKLNKKYLSNAIWVGFKPAKDLYKFYSASDVAVWPLQESMSMNDAAACGLPFIANHTVGARLRLSNNNALLYKMGDEKDLAKKIEYLLLNPSARKQMGARGRQLMENKLSWSKIAKEYISVN